MSANYKVKTSMEFKPAYRKPVENLVDQIAEVCERYVEDTDSVFELPFECSGGVCKLGVDIDLSLSGNISGGVKRIEAVLSDIGKMANATAKVEVTYISSGMEKPLVRFVGPSAKEIEALMAEERARAQVAISRRPVSRKPRVSSGRRRGRPPLDAGALRDAPEWSGRGEDFPSATDVDFDGAAE